MSEDGGATWTELTEYPLLAESPLCLLIDSQAPDTFYLSDWMRRQFRRLP
jgi:hypothetical protein